MTYRIPTRRMVDGERRAAEIIGSLQSRVAVLTFNLNHCLASVSALRGADIVPQDIQVTCEEKMFLSNAGSGGATMEVKGEK